jgi:hypothetical protein
MPKKEEEAIPSEEDLAAAEQAQNAVAAEAKKAA